MNRPAKLFARLAALLTAVRAQLEQHPEVIVAVEVRDPQLLVPAFADLLRASGATFCLVLHGKMPAIEEQLPLLRALWPGQRAYVTVSSDAEGCAPRSIALLAEAVLAARRG